MIESFDLEKTYRMGGEVIRALDRVNLKIGSGESVSVLGPSGSGKSTLMHLIGGLDTPSGGRIEVDGQNLAHLTLAERAAYRNRKVGFVFQSFYLQPHLTALENVALPLKIRGVPRRERLRRAARHLEDVGLADRQKHRPKELSGGQRQRASIARALASEPRFLLADEPTGNLDTATGLSIMELFVELNRERGLTLVVVTHDPEVARLTDRAICLRDGRVIEEAEPVPREA